MSSDRQPRRRPPDWSMPGSMICPSLTKAEHDARVDELGRPLTQDEIGAHPRRVAELADTD